MSTFLQGLGNKIMSPTGRSNTVAPKEAKEKEGKEYHTQGATPPNYDSYEPSAVAVMMSEEEETVLDEVVEEAENTTESDIVDDLDVDSEDLDVDSEELDVDSEELDGDEVDVEESDSDATTATASTKSRVHGYQSSLSESDRAMLQIAYMGMTSSNNTNMDSLFSYISSGSNAGWFASDTSSIYDSILASLAASSSTTTDSTTEVEEETDVEEVEGTENVETDVEETENVETDVDLSTEEEEFFEEEQPTEE